jgi:hypothetical protein
MLSLRVSVSVSRECRLGGDLEAVLDLLVEGVCQNPSWNTDRSEPFVGWEPPSDAAVGARHPRTHPRRPSVP